MSFMYKKYQSCSVLYLKSVRHLPFIWEMLCKALNQINNTPHPYGDAAGQRCTPNKVMSDLLVLDS